MNGSSQVAVDRLDKCDSDSMACNTSSAALSISASVVNRSKLNRIAMRWRSFRTSLLYCRGNPMWRPGRGLRHWWLGYAIA